jgi:signal transduction histidine kinase
MRQFVADASHELRTPLTSVRGLAEFGLQQGSGASPDELLRLMGLINHEASRMGRLVEDLLMLARLDSGRPWTGATSTWPALRPGPSTPPASSIRTGRSPWRPKIRSSSTPTRNACARSSTT